jgi:D-sedoheptulose 7-phosphate isomerase|tara:strand:- start:3777 stop:4367 length:591 start_codon:yes stop_codon:yes gene_type:complete
MNLTQEEQIKNKILARLDIIQTSISLSPQISQSINLIIDCLKKGNKIILFGNGGSAADAQHIAAEFIGRFNINRESLPAIALTSNSSTITALANDFSFDTIFSRQCESLISKDDIAIGISTSGNSINVEKAITTCKNKGAITIALLGNNGGSIKKHVDVPIIVNSSSTPHIQEIHRIIYHIICEIVENELTNPSSK